ncbi:MAG: SsrA-binding protein SmpB [Chthoniobacterales bacterium]
MSEDIVTNRRALHSYHILDRFEAGISLKGTEIKSIRDGLANIQNSFARIDDGEVFIHGVDIQPYAKASHEQHLPRRPRKLLLHRREIDKLFGMTAVKGLALVPLRLYWKNNRVKVELGVGKGKDVGDKRQDIKKREEDREAQREVSRFTRGKGG